MTKLSFEDGLKRFFEYNGKTCPEIEIRKGEMYDAVKKDGVYVPIFYYKYHNKFIGMKGLDLLGSPCALTVTSIDTEPLEKILFREFYLAEYLIGAGIGHLTAYRNGNSINLIIGFKNGAKAHMQCHSASCGKRQFRHELFTTEGFVSDRVVDTVVAQHALNVYTDEGYETYTDSDITLYGLSEVERGTVYAVYDIFENTDTSETVNCAKRIEKAVGLVLEDSRTYLAGRDF